MPLSDFYKIWHGRNSQARILVPKSRKIAILGIKLPIWEKFWGPRKKLSIGAQLQTFLHAMTP